MHTQQVFSMGLDTKFLALKRSWFVVVTVIPCMALGKYCKYHFVFKKIGGNWMSQKIDKMFQLVYHVFAREASAGLENKYIS